MKGRTLLPGLIDAHGHVMSLGERALAVDLSETTSLAAAQAAVKANPGQGAWIRGGGWNQERWGLGRFPTAAELDAVTGNRPAILRRVDGHAVWVNSAAIKLAGITAATPDPAGGRIERDSAGNPNGVLVDAAMKLVAGVVPPLSAAENDAALAKSLAIMASVGLTGAHDAGIDRADLGPLSPLRRARQADGAALYHGLWARTIAMPLHPMARSAGAIMTGWR